MIIIFIIMPKNMNYYFCGLFAEIFMIEKINLKSLLNNNKLKIGCAIWGLTDGL